VAERDDFNLFSWFPVCGTHHDKIYLAAIACRGEFMSSQELPYAGGIKYVMLDPCRDGCGSLFISFLSMYYPCKMRRKVRVVCY